MTTTTTPAPATEPAPAAAGSPSTTPWAALPPELLNHIDPAYPHEDDMVALLGGLAEQRRGQAYLAWTQYQTLGVLYDRLVAAREDRDGLLVDGFADAVAHLCGVYAISHFRAQELLNDAIALRDRLPDTFTCLRDGIITADQAHLIITRTDLLEVDNPHTPHIDTDIATTLRGTTGTWKRARLRDMTDRMIFRHDPTLIRERRKDALAGRGVWTDNRGDGTATLTAAMSAENIRLADAAITALAKSACDHDDRTHQQRRADAAFALLTGTRFECHCRRDDCTAVIPDPETIPPADPTIVIHVVCNQAALTPPHNQPDAGEQTDSEQTDSDQQADSGTGDADTDTEVEIGIGFMDGHGIISDDHVRDLAQRPDAVIRPLVPDGTPTNDDGTVTLPAHQPADPYRPSTALDEDVRIRDGYCADAGCERSAWTADLDHVTEYDHHHPHEGGQTTEANLNAKCRFGHIQKTFGDWTDDQYRDPTTGRLVTRYITPSGYIIDGDAETFEDTFPGLRRIIFRPPDTPTRRQRRRKHFDDHTRINPTRRAGTRAANKHARRRAERHRNRSRHNHDHNHNHNGDPPF
ncbi:hypothetical protein Gbro_4350 [Gordonia bronchialis DSM 43247]|uniref:DUF222 domain-containing protein n=1 Tax=Gordonia bronchialis (strain ATCC 25592 / DSM 43247 / BCRC 13721 / JCM 3198 / KCTC 3076 / NBRC 16047 / NCTC 10667) TaxID=526226 RepID=D0L606_GORB4|nr:DUF222 domain-containing protein [Gordonia bronchialis]ACY23492.1 hypothetical protein Gbro_4350 [Gordonia bronchialis DSM 43247]MCC3321664.1 13E12 repeat family protein [Gordonia bronchialis]STQ66491.1 Domain of uncharacterised function DUF222 [Gordonia bronchialis]